MPLSYLPLALKNPCDSYTQTISISLENSSSSNQLLRALEQHLPQISRTIEVQVDTVSKIIKFEGNVSSYYKKQIIYKVSRQTLPSFSVIDRLLVASLANDSRTITQAAS